MKLFEAFAGIGAFARGFEGVAEVLGFSEFDKYATTSYCAIHNKNRDMNYGDITKIDTDKLPDFDLFTWGFPCQDISVAGKQKGIIEGETRSGLYYEGLRILKAKLPKYSIIENVKNLTGKKFKAEFEQIFKDLEGLGYTNYWKVLNLKNYGLPQNRERVFIVSIRGEHKPFEFEEGFDNGLRLKDMLEDEVDEKYYIKSDKVQKLLEQLDWKNKDKICCDMTVNTPKFKDVGNCITARYDAGIQNQKSIGLGVACPVLTPDRAEKRQNGRRFKEDGETMFTLTGQDRHGVLTYSPYVDKKYAEFYEENGYYPELFNPYNKAELTDYSPTLTAQGDSVTKSGTILKMEQNYRIRKLTPTECWRLMGFTDTDIQKCIDAGISNSQLYKQAGNSIGVPIIRMIARQLVKTEVSG